jgi:hypothetical protein
MKTTPLSPPIYTPNNAQAQELLLRLRRRQLYVFCDECNVPPAVQAQGFRRPTAADIAAHHSPDGLVRAGAGRECGICCCGGACVCVCVPCSLRS